MLDSASPHYPKIAGCDPKLISTTLMGLGLQDEKQYSRKNQSTTGHRPNRVVCLIMGVGEGRKEGHNMDVEGYCRCGVSMWVCAHMCTYICMCALCRGQKLIPGIVLNHSQP